MAIPTKLLVLGGHGAGTPPLAGRATRHLLEPPGVLWRAALGSAAPRVRSVVISSCYYWANARPDNYQLLVLLHHQAILFKEPKIYYYFLICLFLNILVHPCFLCTPCAQLAKCMLLPIMCNAGAHFPAFTPKGC